MTSCSQCGVRLRPGTREEHCVSCAIADLLKESAMPDYAETSTHAGWAGRYELLEEIARGGMGIVWRARQAGLDRVVAIKRIREGAWASLKMRQRFMAEARSASRLRHPHIVTIHEIGEHEGLPFFSMELIDGPNLEQFVGGRPLAPNTAAGLLLSITQAVQYAHGEGILHRDIKPQNILLDAASRPYVTDFGLARDLLPTNGITATGELIGSPAFMSPEQISGKHGQLGPATDVFSLGGLLYYLLTGRAPFESMSLPDLFGKIRSGSVVPVRTRNPLVPRDLETICHKCLQVDPADRYEIAADLAADLGRFLRCESVAARPLSALGRALRWCRNRPSLAASCGVALLAVITALVAGGTAWYRAGEIQRVAKLNRTAEAERLLIEMRHLRESAGARRPSLALSLAQEAKELNNSPEYTARLRDEAAACLMIPDVAFTPVNWFGATNHVDFRPGALVFSPDLQACALREAANIVVRRSSDGIEMGRLSATNASPTPGGFESNVRIRAVSASGRWLALNDDAKARATLWDLHHEPPKQMVDVAQGSAGFAGFLSGEDWPAFAGVNGSLAVYDLSAGRRHELGFLSWVLRKATSWSPFWRVRRMTVGAGGRLAAASIQDFTSGERPLLTLFDIPGGLLLRRFEMESHAQDVALNPGGDLIVAALAGGQRTEVLDVLAGRKLMTINERCFQPGAGSRPESLGLFWQSNRVVEGHLIGRQYCRELRHTWESMNYRFADGFTSGGIEGLTFSPDNRFLAAVYPPRIGFWDLTGNAYAGWHPARSAVKPRFHPNESGVFLLSTQEIKRLDFEIQSNPRALKLEAIGIEPAKGVFGEAAFDSRGTILAVAEPLKNQVALLDGTSLKFLRAIGPHAGVSKIALSGDARWLATAPQTEGDIQIWDLETGGMLRRLSEPGRTAFAFSPDGRWLALGLEQAYEVQDTRSGEKVATLPVRLGQNSKRRALAFSPDARWLAVLMGESDAALVDTGTWRTAVTLPPRTPSAFGTLTFSGDGTLLAGGGEGGNICVWDWAAIQDRLTSLQLASFQPAKPREHRLEETNDQPLLIHHAGFPFPSFPVAYPTNAAGLSLPGDYNLRRDFSITENPSGVWRYGTKSEPAARFHRFVIPRRDLRDLEGRGDYQNFSWCEEPGREPAMRYHPGPETWVHVARDPDTGEERTWKFTPAMVYVAVTDGEHYRENAWAGVRFEAPRSGAYEFRVRAHSFPQFARFQKTTRVELAVLKGAVAMETRLLAPDEQAAFQQTITLENQSTVEFLLSTQPQPNAAPSVISLDIEVYHR